MGYFSQSSSFDPVSLFSETEELMKSSMHAMNAYRITSAIGQICVSSVGSESSSQHAGLKVTDKTSVLKS